MKPRCGPAPQGPTALPLSVELDTRGPRAAGRGRTSRECCPDLQWGPASSPAFLLLTLTHRPPGAVCRPGEPSTDETEFVDIHELGAAAGGGAGRTIREQMETRPE